MILHFNYVVGIDISKKTFDVCISENNLNSELLQFKVFQNNAKGFKAFVKWLSRYDISLKGTLFCMENTGLYHRSLASYLCNLKATVWVASGSQIKWSIGIQRGKTDKVDAKRIMVYAIRHIDKLKPYSDKDVDLQQLADLLALRRRLKDSYTKLLVPLKELKATGLTDHVETIEQAMSASINALKNDIKDIEKRIKNLIEQSKQLKETYSYVTSVKSIGLIAACHLMIYTDCFTRFKSAKQIAAYSGIAPFEYKSGTSVKGRTRVHHLANKNLKTILHMCAISSLAHNEEMKIYAARKVGEGKNKMLVLNSIRNKLLSRVFSCVKNKKMYTPHIAV